MKKWLLSLLVFPVSALAGGQLVLSPVHVISMSDGSVARDRAVVVEAGRIEAVLPASEAPIATGDTRWIDGRGAWVIPGLAEMHAHVPPRQSGEQHVRDFLALMLANGVTTIRGMLGEPWHLELRDMLDRQEWPGPRLVTSGPSFNGNSVTSPEQAARRAHEQAAAGYDFLKLHPGLEPEEYEAIVAAARELGIPFAGHVSFAVGLDAALAARQDTIDHLDGYAQEMLPPGSELSGTAPSWFGLNLASGIDPSMAAQLARSTALAGVWNVPTQSLFETTSGEIPMAELLRRPGMEYVSGNLRSDWQRSVEGIRGRTTESDRRNFLDSRRRLIHELQEAGAGLLLGSDAPQIMNVPGFSIHQELAFLVDAGLTPLQALQSGTLNVARFFGAPDLGEVIEGYVADFILLEASPVEDITATSGIMGVMRAGQWFGREALDEMLKGVRERGF